MQRCKCGVDLIETKEKHTDANEYGICDVCNLAVGASSLNDPNSIPVQKDSAPGWVIPAVVVAVILLAVTVLILVRRRNRYN